MPERFSLRLGTLADLPTLGDIDNDAGTLFEEAGLFLDLPETHEFPLSERRRWRACLASRTTLIALDRAHRPAGFAAVGKMDGGAWLAQLSVRRGFMRQGLGSALLEASAELAGALGSHRFWLTTYRHLPWNQPFYERHGFAAVPDDAGGAELREAHAFEKRWLPLPEQRVIMCRNLHAA